MRYYYLTFQDGFGQQQLHLHSPLPFLSIENVEKQENTREVKAVLFMAFFKKTG